ncbi:aspartyl protease family protein At5g10770-like [Panicum virgatum]|uniref:aspartyl protease family protein At5g10770-like n=1 Tax=Panicum virgatum TaxID=38727 RepID=UPI0019D55DED|nr:aspartyl protease family protein At5g10770-like [Panicum virgatum]
MQFLLCFDRRRPRTQPSECRIRAKMISSSNRAFLPLARRRGPGSPAQTEHEPRLAEALRRDEARWNHIIGGSVRHTAVGSPDSGVVIPAELGYSVDSLEYVVTVGLGTPAVPQTVVVDSGSDFAWVQCEPCDSGECSPQKDPLFDPRKSSTYAPVPCDSGACRDISYNEGNGCTGEKLCGFALSYADGSNSTGVYSRDKLTLAPGVAVEGFRFGCIHGRGGWHDTSAGLIGLGSSPESLVSQAAPSYGGAFSYCLPPTGSAAGFLALGRPGDASGFALTPMHPSAHVVVFYKVTLTGISVAGRPLDVAPSAFPHGDYGMILDSDTVITVLPAEPYAALRAVFRRAMAAYPPAPPIHPVDTCYNLTGYGNVTVPGMALTFLGGATVELDNPSGILVEGCLAFRGLRPDIHGNGIIGNVNQRAFEVLYDPEQLSVGFRAGAC